jgi:surface polysaccharide O-acyltransferase-like enzyme
VVLERFALLAKPGTYLMVFAVSALLFVFARLPVYFGLAGVVYLLPFFMGGLACRRFDIRSKRSRWLAAALFAGAAAWLATRPSHTAAAAAVFAGLIVSLSIVFLLLRSGWRVRWLAYVGSFSFAIYLMHVFFTAASRLFFSALGLSDPYVHTLLGTAAGVLAPMSAAYFISRSPRLNLYLLGVSPSKGATNT